MERSESSFSTLGPAKRQRPRTFVAAHVHLRDRRQARRKSYSASVAVCGGPEEKRAVCHVATPESPEAMSVIATPTFLSRAQFPSIDSLLEDAQRENEKAVLAKSI